MVGYTSDFIAIYSPSAPRLSESLVFVALLASANGVVGFRNISCTSAPTLSESLVLVALLASAIGVVGMVVQESWDCGRLGGGRSKMR